MTAIEPMAPLPEEPLLPATVSPPRSYRRVTAPMPMVRVNLLPAEVVAARRGHRTRRVVLVALGVLVLALGAVSFVARSGIGDARGELAAAEAVNTNLRAQQTPYAEVVTAQNDLKQALTSLAELSRNDLGWAAVARTVRAAVPAGLTLTGVEGTGASDSGTAGSVGGAPGGTGTTAVPVTAPATLVLAGSAVDPQTVAAYVDALAQSPTLANVVATSVSYRAESHDYSFGVNADVTPQALSHRFDVPGGQ